MAKEVPAFSWAEAAGDAANCAQRTGNCAFLLVGHGRRQLLWFAVTRHPTIEWLAQQIVEAFPWHTAPDYLLRNNDAAYGSVFTRRLRAMGIQDRPIATRSPWQNAYVERLIGTVRGDCLDHILIFGEAHLHRVLTLYSLYYNQTCTHLGLGKDVPLGRAVECSGTVIAVPMLSGLHPRYARIWFSGGTAVHSITSGNSLTRDLCGGSLLGEGVTISAASCR